MILIDGIIYSLQQSGGISVYLNELLKQLKLNGIESDCLIYPNNNHYAQNMTVTNNPRLSIQLERYLDVKIKNKNQGNVIFHSSYYRLPKSNSGIKVITTVHDFTYEVYPDGLKTKLHHWQKKKAILNSDGIICISHSTKRDLLHFIPEAKDIPIKVIYNGVADFKPLTVSVKEKKDVLFVGARGGYKNFETCAHSLKNHTELNLVAIGGGKFSSDELAMLNNILPGRFKHAGFISEQELNQYYSDAFCLVYPSLYEGFGIPIIEAMKSACPVIASNSSSIKEIATDASILLDDINKEKISEALTSLHDELLRNSLISKGIKRASLYSWSKMGIETINFYNEIREGK
jgi:mannosyltransferase